MKNSLNEEFKNNCGEDINSILNKVEEYLPNLHDWQFNNGAIFEEEKKILLKSIVDDDNKKIGNQIIIDIKGEKPCKYNLTIADNLVCLNMSYSNNNTNVEELYSVCLNDNTIERFCCLNIEGVISGYQEHIDLKNSKIEVISSEENIIENDTLNNIMNILKENNLKKKNVRTRK